MRSPWSKSPARSSPSLPLPQTNGIGDSDEDLEALKALAAALVASQTLTHVDILYNRIGEKGANALLATFGPEGPPSKVRQLLVDSMLPQPLFERRGRLAGGRRPRVLSYVRLYDAVNLLVRSIDDNLPLLLPAGSGSGSCWSAGDG